MREGRRRAASERPLPHAPALSILPRLPAPALGLPARRPAGSLPRPLAAPCARRPRRGGGARPWRRRRHLAVPRGRLPGAARAAAGAWLSSLAPGGRRALSGRVWVGGDLRACARVCDGKGGGSGGGASASVAGAGCQRRWEARQGEAAVRRPRTGFRERATPPPRAGAGWSRPPALAEGVAAYLFALF